MRPKRPLRRPPAPPPPLPAVVTPEDLDAINTPDIDKLPAYISPGKFQWKPPVPGPKGDTGDTGAPGAPGEPGATVRPITPPVTNVEIAAAAVTPDKLNVTAPATDGQLYSYDATGKFKPVDPPTGGSTITMLAAPVEVLSIFTNVDYIQDVDLSSCVPASAKAVIVDSWIYGDGPTIGYSHFYFCSATGGIGPYFSNQVTEVACSYPNIDGHYIIPISVAQKIFVKLIGDTATWLNWKINVIGYIE